MNNREVYMLGAGGHARSVAALANSCGLFIEGFYDDNFIQSETIGSIKAKGKIAEILTEGLLILAIGDNIQRRQFFNQYSERLLKENLIHSSVILINPSTIGKSNFVFPGVIINAFSKIGDNNIINSGSIIEHESIIGSHSHISVGSIISGRCKIEDNCFIGAGAVIKDSIKICQNVIVGAGAVVVKNITEPGVYAGVPARKIK